MASSRNSGRTFWVMQPGCVADCRAGWRRAYSCRAKGWLHRERSLIMKRPIRRYWQGPRSGATLAKLRRDPRIAQIVPVKRERQRGQDLGCHIVARLCADRVRPRLAKARHRGHRISAWGVGGGCVRDAPGASRGSRPPIRRSGVTGKVRPE